MRPQPVTKEEPPEEQPLQASSVARDVCKQEEMTPERESISRTDVTHAENGETDEKYSTASPSHTPSRSSESLEQEFSSQPIRRGSQSQVKDESQVLVMPSANPETRAPSKEATTSVKKPAKSSKDDRLRCAECDDKFKSKQSLTLHIKLSHPEAYKRLIRFACSVCEAGFINRHTVVAHMDREHGLSGVGVRILKIDRDEGAKGLLRCPKCDKVVKWKQNLTWHIKKTHPGFYKRLTRFFCPLCDKGFVTRGATKNHIHQEHAEQRGLYARIVEIDDDGTMRESENGELVPERAEDAEVAMMKEVPEGEEDSPQDATSTSPASEKRHHNHLEQNDPRTSHHQKQPRSQQEYREHNHERPTSQNQTTQEDKPENASPSKGQLRCPECGQERPTSEALQRHLLIVHPENFFICPECHGCFPTRFSIVNHIYSCHAMLDAGTLISTVFNFGSQGTTSEDQQAQQSDSSNNDDYEPRQAMKRSEERMSE